MGTIINIRFSRFIVRNMKQEGTLDIRRCSINNSYHDSLVICAVRDCGDDRGSRFPRVGLEPQEEVGSGWGHQMLPLTSAGGLMGRLNLFPPTSPRTSWLPTLLAELAVLSLHLLLILVTVVVIVGVMLYILKAEAGHVGHVRAHFLGAPVGGVGEALLDPGMTGWGDKAQG